MYKPMLGTRHATTLILTLGLLSTSTWLSAQMATQPLLTRSTSVEPNLVFMYDDSASMPGTGIYQYGGSSGVFGMTGPGGGSSSLTSNTYASQSPFVNLIYYNPRIRYKLRVDANGNDIDTSTLAASTTFKVYFYKKTSSSTSATVWDNSGNNPTLSSSYFNGTSGTSYQPPAVELQAGASTSTPYPFTASSTTTHYPKFLGRTDCVSDATRCTWSEELRNYSIWKAYHSDRDKLAKTGIGLAFKSIGPTIRVGWGRINTLDGGSLDSGVALFDATTKAAFYTWLYGISANVAGTPNRLALDTVGKYFSRSDSDGPWGSTPRAASKGSTTLTSSVSTEPKTSHLSCRRSFAMLMTDGYYNDSAPSVGNVDGTNGPVVTKPDGGTYQYNASASQNLYKDSVSNTFADVAFKYWVNDLRTDLPNKVPTTTANESFWQNVSFYAIGLGVFGTLPQTQATLDSIKAGSTVWPTPVTNDPKSIDDMWHATLNARGAMLTATDSQSLNDSVDSMMASINQLTTTQSGVAVSTASLETDTRKYTPQYTTAVWTGNVTARNLDPATGNETTTAWQVLDKDETGKIYNGIPAHGSRNIVVGNAATSGTRAVNFSLADMTSAGLIGDMVASARTTSMINYLRGDQSNEGDSGSYRARAFLLGDIVNSSPVFIKGRPGRELSDPSRLASPYVLEIAATTNPLPGSGTSYTTYLQGLANRTEGALFVGANDGMLHVFRDGTPSIQGGVETFAYIPRTMLPKLHLLADKLYGHQYFVDGPNIETDAYWGGSWKQLLVGSTGAGAKTLYALDVTDPITMDASKLLWEINPSSTGFANLGYVLSDVQTGPTNGKDDDGSTSNDSVWAGFFGNGYESASGTASLFVVNLQTGALIREIQTPTAQGGPWSATVGGISKTYKNGLGGVKLILDANAQRVIGAYAGDLRGNLWRFDLSDSNAANWTVSLMFSTGSETPSATVPTGYPRPITAQPEYVKHPDTGRVVAFGTGKFFEDSDVPPPYNTQALYGLWDKTEFGSALPGSGYPIVASSLVERAFTTVDGVTDITQPDGTAPTPIDWTSKSGWFATLPHDGERLVYPIAKISNRNSRVLKYDTLSPANVSLDACTQAGTGTQWKISMDGLHGANPGKAPDIDPANWAPISGDNYNMVTQGIATGRSTTMRIASRTSSTETSFSTIQGGDASAKVETYRCQILGNCPPVTPPPLGPLRTINSREWRQLYMR
jgi:type IV pilus assembly protein PilY1